MMDYHDTHVLLHGLLHWSFILRADQTLISSTRVLLTDSTMLFILCGCSVVSSTQHTYYSGHTTNDNHGNHGVTYVRYFMYGDNKVCVKKIVFDAGDKVSFC